jgi:hypothetical protein
MERFIIKETHISPPDNKKTCLLVLYAVNVVYHMYPYYIVVYMYLYYKFFCLIRPSFKYFAQCLQKP